MSNLRFALRSLRRSPAYSVTAIFTLVIGIAACVTIFALVNGILLRPLPYKAPDRLVGIWHDMPRLSMTHVPNAAITYLTYRDDARTLDGIGVYKQLAVNVADDGSASSDAQRLTSAVVSASLLDVLGVSARQGRIFTEADDQPGAAPVALISDGFWRAHFGARSDIVGRFLIVNGARREIVGVMPPSFRFPDAATQAWFPLGLDRNRPPADAYTYPTIARLKPGASVDAAQRELASILPRVAARFPTFVPGLTTQAMLSQFEPRPVVTPYKTDVSGSIAPTLWMLAGATLLLLLVACFNVANLSLVRADARQREMAVRQALGASKSRVLALYIGESSILAGAAMLIGVALAWGLAASLVHSGPSNIPRLAEVDIDWRTGLVAFVVAAFAAAVCALLPALRSGRGFEAIRDARGGTANRSQHRVRNVLVAAQMAMALVVLASSGLLLRSFERLHAVRPGFDADHVASFWVSLPRLRATRDSDIVRFYSTLLERAAHVPGVQSVGLTSRLPLVVRGVNETPLYPEDQPSYATKLPPLQLSTTIAGDYFRAMRIPLLAGKVFDEMNVQREGDAIISRRTSEFFWKDSTGAAALGKRFRMLPSGPWYTVVGVVGNVQDSSLANSPAPMLYLPELVQRDSVTKATTRTMALVVRTNGDPTPVIAAAQRVVHDIDPTLPTFDAQPMAAILRASTARLAFIILVLGAAAVVTLIIGAVGLYGVMSYVVALRRREFGIRIALGATPAVVAGATTRHGLVLSSVGIATGVALFALTARFMRSLLFGVSPWDGLAMGGAVLVLLAMALVASWIPARRAGGVDPAEALRSE